MANIKRFAQLSLLCVGTRCYADCPGGQSLSAFAINPFRLQGTLLSATQRQKQFTGSIKLVGVPNKTACGWGYTRTIFDLGTTYDAKRSDTSPLNITRRHIAGFQELVSLGNTNRYYAVGNAEVYHNNSLGIRLQQAYGAGLGGLFFGDNLELTADIRGVGQQFYKQRNQRFAAAGLRENYSLGLPFLAPGATIGETFSVILPIDAERSRQFRAFSVLRIPFNPRVAFSVTAYDDYAQNAPPGFRRNYLTTTVGFDLTFTK